MGSQNLDKGQSLWPIYLDLLVRLVEKGQLTKGYAHFLLSNYWRDLPLYAAYGPEHGIVLDATMGSNPRGDGAPGPYCAGKWSVYVDQMFLILENWKKNRSNPGKVKLHFPPGTLLAFKLGTALDLASRIQTEKDAHAAGLSDIQITSASLGGWSPTYSPGLPAALRGRIRFRALVKSGALQAQPKPKIKIHFNLSPADLAAIQASHPKS